jgi:hypothetical protein
VKVEALLEGALVDRQHTSWDDRAGEEFVEDVVLDGLTDAVVRHHLAPGDVGGGLIARRLEQETPEAVGDRAPAGDLGMAFATGALAIAAGKQYRLFQDENANAELSVRSAFVNKPASGKGQLGVREAS